MTNAVTRTTQDEALGALDKEMEKRQATLASSAASLIDPKRLMGVVLAAFTRNPSLWDCDPITIARAVVEAAQYGLEPTGAIGGAHLVPFRNSRTGKMEAQLIIDYRGYIQLARRSGEVAKVEARMVRERDLFVVDGGTQEGLTHKPYLGPEDPGNFTHVYAVITYRDGVKQFDWDTIAWVDTIRKRSKAANNGPWVTDYAEMAKKSMVRRLLKMAPLTIEARAAIDYEEREEAEVYQAPARQPSPQVTDIRKRLGIAPAAQASDVGHPGASGDNVETPTETEVAGIADLTAIADEVFSGDVLTAMPIEVSAALPVTPDGEILDEEDDGPCNEPSPSDPTKTCIRPYGHKGDKGGHRDDSGLVAWPVAK
jgi:recombination protein RecT